MVSNKVAGSHRDIGTQVYHWVNDQDNTQLFEYLLSLQNPTAEALAEYLFSISIENEDVHIVKRILDSGLDPNELKCSDPSGRQITPLQRACQLGSVGLVRALLDAKADVNVISPDSYSPLGYAVVNICQAGNIVDIDRESEDIDSEPEDSDNDLEDSQAIELVRILLDAGASVNPASGESPLAIAASYHHLELVTFLLDNDADPDLSPGYLKKPPLIGVLNSFGPPFIVVSIVRKLVQAGANVNISTNSEGERIFTALEYACDSGYTEVVKVLLKAGARTTEQALVKAISSSLPCVKLLIRNGAPVTETTFEKAADLGDEDMCQLLLNSAQESMKGRFRTRMFTSAMKQGHQRLIEELSAAGVELHATVRLTDAIEAAAERGDIATLRLLLHEDSRYRETVLRSLGDSLYLAIAHEQRDVTEMLLAAGADVNGSRTGRAPLKVDGEWTSGASDTGRTPLFAAINLMDAPLSEILLTSGAAVNVLSSEGHIYSVLPLAVARGERRLIKILIDEGAEIDACSRASESRSNDRKSAVTVAAERNDLDSIKLLVEAGADVNASFGGDTALAAAVQNGNTEIINYLVGCGAKPDQECLNIAIEKITDDALVERFLAVGPDVTEKALLAAAHHNLDRMQMVLTARWNRCGRYPRAFGSRTLQRAIASSSTSMVNLLLSYGINSTTIVYQNSTPFRRRSHPGLQRDESAFGTAIRLDMTEDLALVQRLLNAGADPNKIVSEQPTDTALLAAIKQNNVKLVEMLVSAGAKVNPRLIQRISRTPLQLAVEQGSMDIVNLLLEKGADVDAPAYDQYGATALQFAAIKGFLGAASMLLEKNADVNAPAAKVGGRTALEGASEHGRIDVMQLLLDSGARVIEEGSRQFERARDLASKNGHRAARRLLENYRTQLLSPPANLRLSPMDNGNTNGDLACSKLPMENGNNDGDPGWTEWPMDNWDGDQDVGQTNDTCMLGLD
ncbi:hypothetical protein AYL99_03712 [Fonsecaea erecta]|uniref:Uncharacterized protein n=1 Tax=Fonsecaea erecta TaxID=1367422 RepID=A0A178ZNX0_9EURO|nr:hypothetical protein AYL99_03712 [Fonsecaea erecta]OAP61509.1 hypothetical protein AYL99_03712 [Fonsecaea erecta]